MPATRKASADDAATPPAEDDRPDRIAALDHDGCPKCQTGVLRVVGFDLAAVHEALQGTMVAPFTATGGSVHRHCFLCGYHESEPIDKLEGTDE